MWGMRKAAIAAVAGVCVSASPALAQDLVYEPINPSFGGNPFNSGHLLAIANAQNDYEEPVDEVDETQQQLDRFIRSLQSRLLSSLSTQVANAIFGENAQDEGTIVFGDQTISFVRTLEGIELTITSADGSVTVITIPTLITPEDESQDDDGSSDDGSSDGGGSGKTGLFADTGASSGKTDRTPLEDAFEERVRIYLAEDPLAASGGRRALSAESALLYRQDSLVTESTLAKPSSLADPNALPIR